MKLMPVIRPERVVDPWEATPAKKNAGFAEPKVCVARIKPNERVTPKIGLDYSADIHRKLSPADFMALAQVSSGGLTVVHRMEDRKAWTSFGKDRDLPDSNASPAAEETHTRRRAIVGFQDILSHNKIARKGPQETVPRVKRGFCFDCEVFRQKICEGTTKFREHAFFACYFIVVKQ